MVSPKSCLLSRLASTEMMHLISYMIMDGVLHESLDCESLCTV